MIKRTIYIENPAYLRIKDAQLVVDKPDRDTIKMPTIPIEDIGLVLLDNPQITISHNLIRALQGNNVAMISCDEKHMPASMMLPIEGHSEQSERFKAQINASVPLKKNLWQQVVMSKINNQGRLLSKLDLPNKRLQVLEKRVTSGDDANVEGQAAKYYWKTLMHDQFYRDQYGPAPNHLLNYGYIIIRSMMARALVGSGMLPTLGIFHKNKYNAYCLADDLMEPYRPFVDQIAYELWLEEPNMILTKAHRVALLGIATADVLMNGKTKPLMLSMSYLSSSLVDCFMGKKRKLNLPVFPLKE